jgi:hypothetical protein
MLASRLGSHLQVFSILALAIQLFALFPRVVHHLRGYSPRASLLLSWLLSALAVILFLPLSRAISGIYVAAWLFITFVCPFLLQFIMQFKEYVWQVCKYAALHLTSNLAVRFMDRGMRPFQSRDLTAEQDDATCLEKFTSLRYTNVVVKSGE